MFKNIPQNKNKIFPNHTRVNREEAMSDVRSSLSHDLINFMSQSTDCWAAMNVNNEWGYANHALNRLVGLKENYDFTGRHISEPPAKVFQTCAPEFIEHNTLALNRGKIKTLDIQPSNSGNWYCYIFEVTAMKDEDNRSKGIIVQGKSILEEWQQTAKALQKAVIGITGENSQHVSMEISKIRKLSDTEAEILFFLLCRKEQKQISRYLNMNINSLKTHIRRIKEKIGVHSTQQIIDKAISMDWHKLLPERLMGQKQLSMILD